MKLLITALLLLPPLLFAKTGDTASDLQPWRFEAKKVFAIGDIHGDYAALVKILRTQNLIDSNGDWLGEKTHLVMIGDLNNRHHDHRIIIELLMRLEHQAGQAGGKVHVLLGNHEQMLVTGKIKHTSSEEIYSFADFSSSPSTELQELLGRGFTIFEAGMILAFHGNTRYARWLRQRNTIIQINDTLFVHAGLNTWALDHTPGEINASIRRWFSYWQNASAEMPSPDQNWVVSENGPLWTTEFSALKVDANVLDEILEKYQAKRVVVGHKRTNGDIEFLSKGKIIKIDTGISRTLNGNLSVLELNGKGPIAHNNIRRPSDHLPMRKKEIVRLPAEDCMKTFLLANP